MAVIDSFWTVISATVPLLKLELFWKFIPTNLEIFDHAELFSVKLFPLKVTFSGVILEYEGSICQRHKRALFPYKKLQKGNSNLSNPYVRSIFTLLLIKQIFEKNKSMRPAFKRWTQFWPRITSDFCIYVMAEMNTEQKGKIGVAVQIWLWVQVKLMAW